MVEDPLLAMISAAAPASPPPPEVEQPTDDHNALETSAKLPDSPMQGQFTDDPFDYIPVEPKADQEEQPHLVTHTKVYAIAEK